MNAPLLANKPKRHSNSTRLVAPEIAPKKIGNNFLEINLSFRTKLVPQIEIEKELRPARLLSTLFCRKLTKKVSNLVGWWKLECSKGFLAYFLY